MRVKIVTGVYLTISLTVHAFLLAQQVMITLIPCEYT